MEYGICDLSAVPVRAEASDKSEMISQLLFGERLMVVKKQAPWVKIRMSYDDYEGWIDEKQYLPITKAYHDSLETDRPHISLDLVQSVVSSNRHIPILTGSELPHFDGMNFKLMKEKFIFNGQAIDADHHRNIDKFLERTAFKYLHAPYLWGGRGPFGIDCSGFTQVVFKILGVKLPRDAYQQAELGDIVDFAAKAQEGDLAFFENNEGRITHVGIVLTEGRIIHAAGKVRVDAFDQYGIHNKELKKYTHKLKVIKRIR